MAIIAAVIIVSITMLLGKEPIPLSQKFGMVLLIFLISLPGILLTLFQMTCMVTGSGFMSKDSPLGKRWWCSLYTWIIAAVLIVYCVFLIVISIMTLVTGEQVLKDIAIADAENFENKLKEATNVATEHFTAQKAEQVADPQVDPAAEAVAPVADAPAVQPFEEPEGFSSCGAPF
jgi:RsiW-degrading membrane proteinase PrsW (M82 family)